jgi:hypothetical protein
MFENNPPANWPPNRLANCATNTTVNNHALTLNTQKIPLIPPTAQNSTATHTAAPSSKALKKIWENGYESSPKMDKRKCKKKSEHGFLC